MSPSAPAERVIDYVDRHREELGQLLSELVAIPSVFPTGDYEAIAARIEHELSSAGAQTERIVAPRERVEALGLGYPRPNVVGRLGSGERPVLLIGTHMDVVEAGDPAAWARDPFGGTIVEGKVWGRGTCDAKSALAAQVYAVRAIVESGFTLAGTLLLAASVDDEGGHDKLNWPGMTFLAEEGLARQGLPQPDMVINGEASGLDRVCGSFMGRLVLEITVRGETAHASTPHGANAIDLALTLADRLKGLPLHEHPVQGRETLTICSIEGGAPRYSDVPDSCTLGIDVRVVPPYGTRGAREEIRAVLRELEREDEGFRTGGIRILSEREPFEVARDHPLVQAIESAAGQVGVDATYAPILGTGDLEPFLIRGSAGVTYGPGSISRVHRPNEFIELDSLVQQTKIYALTALSLCRGR